jgi:hypothetical protein
LLKEQSILIKEDGTVSKSLLGSINKLLEVMSSRRIKSRTLLDFGSQHVELSQVTVVCSTSSGRSIAVRRRRGSRPFNKTSPFSSRLNSFRWEPIAVGKAEGIRCSNDFYLKDATCGTFFITLAVKAHRIS